jgi:RNA polymerase sigma factor (sigma-70 family)
MATTGLRKLLGQLHQALPAPGGLPDGQLLAHFLATRDEAAFAALVRRHGPMVLGVCRRLLGHEHDAEDAFQATFLVLARRGESVVKRESVGSWLHGVACRTALQAAAANARRRARERQVENMPHPEVAPAEPHDWLPLLDRELARLPEKYRAVLVLCDLEGRPRREAARQLGVPEGTVSSRLATARKTLAGRLARHGLAPAGAALAAALAEGAVAAPLVWSTARAAALVAAGQLAAAPVPAVVLMKGVLKAMFMTRLKRAVGVVLVLLALGGGASVYRAGGAPGTVQAAPPGKPEGTKPPSEVEALRKENELLKLNLQVVLEKVRAQEDELRALKGNAGQVRGLAFSPDGRLYVASADGTLRLWDAATGKQVEGDAVKAWRGVRDKDEMRRALDGLEEAVKKLREQLRDEPKPGGAAGTPPAR